MRNFFKYQEMLYNKKGCRSSLFVIVPEKSLYDVALDLVEEISTVVAVDVQCQILGKVKAEDTHDRLCVDSVSAGDDVYVIVALCYDVYEVLYVIDRVDADCCCCHILTSFLDSAGRFFV